jgi:hypothetical protein
MPRTDYHIGVRDTDKVKKETFLTANAFFFISIRSNSVGLYCGVSLSAIGLDAFAMEPGIVG